MKPREAASNWIRQLPKGARFTYADLYEYLKTTFPSECAHRGTHRLGKEPQYQVDARYAVWRAMEQNDGLLRHTGNKTERERI
jgi:hypothetical protein